MAETTKINHRWYRCQLSLHLLQTVCSCSPHFNKIKSSISQWRIYWRYARKNRGVDYSINHLEFNLCIGLFFFFCQFPLVPFHRFSIKHPAPPKYNLLQSYISGGLQIFCISIICGICLSCHYSAQQNSSG